jgi:hypothetical protein
MSSVFRYVTQLCIRKIIREKNLKKLNYMKKLTNITLVVRQTRLTDEREKKPQKKDLSILYINIKYLDRWTKYLDMLTRLTRYLHR